MTDDVCIIKLELHVAVVEHGAQEGVRQKVRLDARLSWVIQNSVSTKLLAADGVVSGASLQIVGLHEVALNCCKYEDRLGWGKPDSLKMQRVQQRHGTLGGLGGSDGAHSACQRVMNAGGLNLMLITGVDRKWQHRANRGGVTQGTGPIMEPPDDLRDLRRLSSGTPCVSVRRAGLADGA